MLVTLIADASFCPETNAGGYGCWIASQRGKKSCSGEFRNTVDGSLAAELFAIANGIHVAKQRKLLRVGDTLLIQSDCEGALLYIRQKRLTSVTPDEKLAIEAILANTQYIKVLCQHVKGHTSVRDARSKSNRHCDRQAREHMGNMRARLRRPAA